MTQPTIIHLIEEAKIEYFLDTVVMSLEDFNTIWFIRSQLMVNIIISNRIKSVWESEPANNAPTLFLFQALISVLSLTSFSNGLKCEQNKPYYSQFVFWLECYTVATERIIDICDSILSHISYLDNLLGRLWNISLMLVLAWKCGHVLMKEKKWY